MTPHECLEHNSDRKISNETLVDHKTNLGN